MDYKKLKINTCAQVFTNKHLIKLLPMFCCLRTTASPSAHIATDISKDIKIQSTIKIKREEQVMFENKGDNTFIQNLKKIDEIVSRALTEKTIYIDTFTIKITENDISIPLDAIYNFVTHYNIVTANGSLVLSPTYIETEKCIEYKFIDNYDCIIGLYRDKLILDIIRNSIIFYNEYKESKNRRIFNLGNVKLEFTGNINGKNDMKVIFSISNINIDLLMERDGSNDIYIVQKYGKFFCYGSIVHIELIYEINKEKNTFIFDMDIPANKYIHIDTKNPFYFRNMLSQLAVICAISWMKDDVILEKTTKDFTRALLGIFDYCYHNNISDLINNNIYICDGKLYIEKNANLEFIKTNLLTIDVIHFDDKTIKMYINQLCKYSINKMLSDDKNFIKQTEIIINNHNDKIIKILYDIMKKTGLTFSISKGVSHAKFGEIACNYYKVVFMNEDNSILLSKIRSDSISSIDSINSIDSLSQFLYSDKKND